MGPWSAIWLPLTHHTRRSVLVQYNSGRTQKELNEFVFWRISADIKNFFLPISIICVTWTVDESIASASSEALFVAKFSGSIHWIALHWRHNGRYGVSNKQPHDCILNRLSRHRSKKTSKLRITGLCEGNSPVTGEFPAQRPVTRKMLAFDDVIMKPVW